ncbi:MAG: PCRF domain-containing protein, partial [Clostridia bacterium]|nr:PCRF domain-containing protein [Clostridia bacterium]
MFENLMEAEKHFEEINQMLMDPEVINDTEKYKNLMKEHKNLSPIIEKYREYKTVQNNLEGAKQLIDESGNDPEMREMAEEEYKECKEAIEELTEELKILLLPKDEDDDKNVIIEIRAGTGGEEAALFAHSIYRMYS